MSFADLVKKGASIAIDLPAHLESVTLVIEQKVKAEAEALERAVTPEIEAQVEKMVDFLEKHVEGISILRKAHDALATAEKDVMSAIADVVHHAPADATSTGSDAVPTTPIL